MVEVPVTANTVVISIISRYHFKVPRGGISLGARNFWNQVWEPVSAVATLGPSAASFRITRATFSAPSLGGDGGGDGGEEENERLYRRFKFLAVRTDDERWLDWGVVTRFLNAKLCFQKDKVAVLRAARDKEQAGNIMVTSLDFIRVVWCVFLRSLFLILWMVTQTCDWINERVRPSVRQFDWNDHFSAQFENCCVAEQREPRKTHGSKYRNMQHATTCG